MPCCRSIPPKRSGSGLGLSLCREIIEAHGGRLSSIENRLGGGLQVSFALPSRHPRSRMIETTRHNISPGNETPGQDLSRPGDTQIMST